MIAVIMAGGSGTRLWPLSTPDYPKHLLSIFGDTRSLLQSTYDRSKLITDKVYVVSEASHIKHIKQQLPDVPDERFIVEPARRGTANCLIAVLSYLTGKCDEDEPIIILPADHYIRDKEGFVHSFMVAANVSSSEHKLVLVGAEPTYPATAFGYIQRGPVFKKDSFVFEVQSFKEKPDFETARNYFKAGNYLWNCGYFVASLAVFKQNMKQFAPELFHNYERLVAAPENHSDDVYLTFDNDTIDYALIEKLENILVVPSSFDWMDLGSYRELHKATNNDSEGNHIVGNNIAVSEVENSFIQNHESKPMVVIGLDNLVVINTERGILVARKDLADNVGKLSKAFEEMTGQETPKRFLE